MCGINEGRRAITPEEAETLLRENNFSGQRRVREETVKRYAKAMADGRWTPGTQLASCECEGQLVLVNGQHRLSAVVAHGAPVEFQILVNKVSHWRQISEQYARHDCDAKKRSFGDVLRAAGMGADNIVSLSGGKDSTAVLLGLLERGERVVDAVFFDTGWEFPQMYAHLERLEKFSGITITVLKPHVSFHDLFFHRPVLFRSGENKGKIKHYGYGWPSPLRRWCTREKTRAVHHYLKGESYRADIHNPTECIGFASDEVHRTEGEEFKAVREKATWDTRFPLIEWGMTESAALTYCRERGFDWDGLYNHFDRVSCFCCPLQSLDDLRKLRVHYPDLWKTMLEWGSSLRPEAQRFHHKATLHDLDVRFGLEEVSA